MLENGYFYGMNLVNNVSKLGNQIIVWAGANRKGQNHLALPSILQQLFNCLTVHPTMALSRGLSHRA